MEQELADSDRIFTARMMLGGAGPTVGIKDSIDVAGFPTRCGSAVLREAPAAEVNAHVVTRLIDAGARIVGKTNMHEFAYGLTGINDWTGTPHNTRYPDRIPGGSSSGSAAAVAAGLVAIAIGTDTGGSIRVPAACCGVFGLKPGFGRVSRRGVVPEASTLDCVGPFARDMAMLTHAMEMIDPAFHAFPRPDRDAVVLGVLNTTADPAVAEVCNAAVARTGMATRAVALPSFAAAFDAALTLIAAETFAAFGHHVEDSAMGEDVRTRLLAAGQVTPDLIRTAEAVRDAFTTQVDTALDDVDALVLPTLPILPPTLEAATDSRTALRLSELVRPFNLSGHPALTIPLSAGDDRPVSLQLVGRKGGEAALCALGWRIADILEIHQERDIA